MVSANVNRLFGGQGSYNSWASLKDSCPHSAMLTLNNKWHKQNALSTEVECQEFVYGLVRLAKPEVCLETGSYLGDMSEAIGRALMENGSGILHTCETDERLVPQVVKRTQHLPVIVHPCEGVEVIRDSAEPFDLAFIDSWWMPVRMAEVEAVVSRITPRGWLLLHDTCQNYGALHDWVEALGDWRSVVVQTPY